MTASRARTADTAAAHGRGLALGIACGLARQDGSSRAATGLVAAMLIYNLAVIALLVSAVVGSGLRGVALWPGVIMHLAMAAWCLICLQSRRDRINWR